VGCSQISLGALGTIHQETLMIDEQKNVIKSLEEQKKLLISFKERLKQLRIIPQDGDDDDYFIGENI
tara:strand:+ start:1818 stop:2018 length:201 start_codon:yes stop_codon:yes gene_type:complete